MCFGIRIWSPFYLNTLNIPIENIKCPKNTKNACADIIFSPAIICEAWTVSSLHKHAKPNLCDRQCYPWITLFTLLRWINKNCFNGAMSIRFKPILGGAFYPFWEGLRVSLVQMGALSRTKVDEWTTLTCNPDILSSWNLKYSQFLSIRDSLKEKPSVGYSHKPRKIYNWSNWLITSVFGSLIGTPYFGRSGSLLAHSVGSLCHEKLGPYLVLISRIGRSDWKRDPGT